jgi:thiol-disulfide isomerase/thioredoxin
MKKSLNIIIWIIALAALLIAAYTFYAKNKTEVSIPPLQQNTTQLSTMQQDTTQPSSTQPTQQSSTQQNTAQQATARQSATQPEKIMAPDFTLKDLDGKSIKLSDYQGKIVILNFWAVWCKYCKLEMPDLNELNKELEKGNDAVILAVDVQESADIVNEYLTSNKISLKVLLDNEGTVAQQYGISGYPTTFIVKRDGSLYTYISGQTDKKTLLEIIDKIKKGEPAK